MPVAAKGKSLHLLSLAAATGFIGEGLAATDIGKRGCCLDSRCLLPAFARVPSGEGLPKAACCPDHCWAAVAPQPGHSGVLLLGEAHLYHQLRWCDEPEPLSTHLLHIVYCLLGPSVAAHAICTAFMRPRCVKLTSAWSVVAILEGIVRVR